MCKTTLCSTICTLLVRKGFHWESVMQCIRGCPTCDKFIQIIKQFESIPRFGSVSLKQHHSVLRPVLYRRQLTTFFFSMSCDLLQQCDSRCELVFNFQGCVNHTVMILKISELLWQKAKFRVFCWHLCSFCEHLQKSKSKCSVAPGLGCGYTVTQTQNPNNRHRLLPVGHTGCLCYA